MRIGRCVVAALLCAQSAWAAEEAPSIVPKEVVCDAHRHLDKKTLAMALLDRRQVPISIAVWAQTTESKPPAMDPLGYLVAYGETVCDRGAKCGKDGPKKLSQASLDFITLLKAAAKTGGLSGAADLPGPGLVVTDAELEQFMREYFRNPDYQIACLSQQDSPSEPGKVQGGGENEGAGANLPRPDLRLRGKATDLYAPQGSDAFKAADKASVSYTQDDVKHKRVRVGSGVVGIGFRLSDQPLFGSDGSKGHVDVVPYLGIASNITKASGSEPSVTTNTRQAGFLFYGYVNRPLPYYWTFRPDLLWTLTNKSRLFTTSIGYVPIVVNYVNSTHEFHDGYWFQWIVDGRFVHGHYTSLGMRNLEDSRDFDRLGGDLGFQLDHTGSVLPWSWKVTESYLRGWNGSYKNLSQLKSVLSFTLDDKKLFGIDFIYTNGRDPDTTEKDQSWKISLGVKY